MGKKKQFILSRDDNLHGYERDLSSQNASAAGSLNLLLSIQTEVSSLDNQGNGRQDTLAQDLKETKLGHIKHGHIVSVGSSLRLLVDTLGNHAPQLVNVDDGAMRHASLQVEGSHTDLQQ
jgi:hypothetical protein